MPAHSAETETVSIHERLEQMLSGDPVLRIRAWFDLMARGYTALTVYDEHCAHDGKPLQIQLNALNKHLRRLDNHVAIERRGRLHTPDNVHFGDPQDDTGYGPARGRGGAL